MYRFLYNFYDCMSFIVLLALPLVSLLLLGLTSVCCCFSSNQKRCNRIHILLNTFAEKLFWFLKQETTESGKKHFIVAGLVAPVVYTYFLLYTFLLLVVHCSFTFFDTSININVTPNVNSERIKTCDSQSGNETCLLELHIVEGIESAAVVFSFSVFTFAMITALLLKCSKRCELIRSQKEKTCLPNNRCSSRNVCILFILQAVFTCLPRTILFIMLVWFDEPKDDEKKKSPFFELAFETGFFDKESFLALAAICDSIATAMMTPWYLFKKMETKDDPAAVDSAAVMNSERREATYLYMTEHA